MSLQLHDALTKILVDPQRSRLYSGSQLVGLLRVCGVQLPTDQMEAWQLVSDARYEIELALYRDQALKAAISAILRVTDKQLDHNDLLIILAAACADLPEEKVVYVPLPDDYDEAIALIARLCGELERESEVREKGGARAKRSFAGRQVQGKKQPLPLYELRTVYMPQAEKLLKLNQGENVSARAKGAK